MFHNSLYRLEKSQKKTLTVLLLLFIVLSGAWIYTSVCYPTFPMEPIVVLVGGLATLFASFWPWKPSYKDQRIKGREAFNYSANNGLFVLGNSDDSFTLEFSKGDDTSIHMYSYPSDIDAVALVHRCGRIADIADATALDYSSRSVTPKEGEVVCIRNKNGRYAAVQIHDVKDAKRSDEYDEVTFSYVINPDKKTNFS
ncbi:hypothetical protein ACQZ40_02005 [Agrobacterium sp. 16-172Ci]